jgi:uncharacterized phage protein gp47/JayE
MPLFAENSDKIFGEIMNDLVNSTNITRSSPGSKTRALIESVSKKMGRMYSTFDLNFGQAFLDGAEGKWLGFIGDMMGVPRSGEQAATVTSLDRNVRFSTELGTFGDINSGLSITIPAGTIISTASGGGGIRYRVVVSTVLSSASSEEYVSVQAVRTGSVQNVGRNQLRYHDFNNYTGYLNDSLKVTNTADIVTGSDLETDSNYRFRISNQVVAAESANDTSIRLAALAVPGVADVTYLPYHRGIGTYDLLIKSVTPTVSSSLIAAVFSSVSQVTSQGIVPRVRGPSEIGFSLVGTLRYRRTLSLEEETKIIDAATVNVTNYINGLDIGEEMILQEVLERILSTSDLIKKVGETTKPFDNIFIYRPSRLEDNKIRSTLIDDYTAASDERVIVENIYAGTTPILLRSA